MLPVWSNRDNSWTCCVQGNGGKEHSDASYNCDPRIRAKLHVAPTQQEFSTTPKWLIGSIGLQPWISPTNHNPKVCPSLLYLLLWEMERCSDLSRFLRLLWLFLSVSTQIYPHVSHLCLIRPLLILMYLNPLPPPSCSRMTSVRVSSVVLLSYLGSLS